jgi:hypothetical protein
MANLHRIIPYSGESLENTLARARAESTRLGTTMVTTVWDVDFEVNADSDVDRLCGMYQTRRWELLCVQKSVPSSGDGVLRARP